MLSRREFASLAGAFGAAGAPASSELHWLGLAEAAALLRQRKASPVELTQACLRRIERLNPRLNAFVTVTAEPALKEARQAEKEIGAGRVRSPLHGIPIALKDLFDTAGLRTTAGSQQYAARVPDRDAEVVARLRAAGAVLLGKLNMDEFAYNFTSETSCRGPCRNPWDPRRSPGGSSGGSGVAVAAGMCYAALGSDTGGSIRLPAALCGVTGLKPSFGRVSTRGVVPLAFSLDHVGPLCRSARDAVAVLEAISGPLGKTAGAPAAKLRLGLPSGPWLDRADAEVKTAFEEALKRLAALCGPVRDVALPDLSPAPQLPVFPRAYLVLIQAEAYAFHREMLRRSPDRYHPSTRRSIENGQAISAADYIDAVEEMRRLRAAIPAVFEKADLLLTPAAPGPAFELGAPPDLVFLRNLAPWNLLGLPAISVPCGFTRAGLPIGLQIVGPPGRDALVLQLAEAWQQATDYHQRRPPGGGGA
jgi:aspartyl-tRNA(Asn)/glutamyl-tRNA(Gln) amidotransferase subunit A